MILRTALLGCALLAIVPLLGCEEGPGESPAETHVLNPPTWIHGTWSYCEALPENVNLEFYWKFSAHNVEHRFGPTVTDYQEQAKTSGVTITEGQGQDWYRFEVKSPDGQGGTITYSNRFARDGSRLRWTTSVSGTSTTVTICR